MDQNDLMRHAARCFDKHGVRYFVARAVASIAYGEPRLTNADSIDYSYISDWARKLDLEDVWGIFRKERSGT